MVMGSNVKPESGPDALDAQKFGEEAEVVAKEARGEVVRPDVFFAVAAHLAGELAVLEELRAG
jgi:hypothetical protein